MAQRNGNRWASGMMIVLAVMALVMRPVFGGGAGENLFPTKPGSSWTYSGSAGRAPMGMTANVVSAKTVHGKTTVAIRWTKNGRPAQEIYEVTASAVAQVGTGSDGKSAVTPPLPIIKYPMTVGKAWNWQGKITIGPVSFSGTATVRVAAREKVKTPAGVFNAYRVDEQLTLSGQGGQPYTTLTTYWFAPAVGLIKQSTSLPVQSGQGFVITASVTKYSIK